MPKFVESDYSWIPVWGMVTPNSLQKLIDEQITRFTMKDGSEVFISSTEEFSKSINLIQWKIHNPGQLFTGSFHPINDSQWEDRANWNVKVRPKEPITFPEIFQLRKYLKQKKLNVRSLNVLSILLEKLPRDIILIIFNYLENNNLLAICCVCKSNSIPTNNNDNNVKFPRKISQFENNEINDYNTILYKKFQSFEDINLFSVLIKRIIEDLELKFEVIVIL